MSAILSQLESDLGPVSGLGRQRTLSPRRGTFFWEATRIALDSIRAHKMRSVLTLLGIIIGVASVVTVGGAIEGLGYYVKDRLVSTPMIFGRFAGSAMVARLSRPYFAGGMKPNSETARSLMRTSRESTPTSPRSSKLRLRKGASCPLLTSSTPALLPLSEQTSATSYSDRSIPWARRSK